MKQEVPKRIQFLMSKWSMRGLLEASILLGKEEAQDHAKEGIEPTYLPTVHAMSDALIDIKACCWLLLHKHGGHDVEPHYNGNQLNVTEKEVGFFLSNCRQLVGDAGERLLSIQTEAFTEGGDFLSRFRPGQTVEQYRPFTLSVETNPLRTLFAAFNKLPLTASKSLQAEVPPFELNLFTVDAAGRSVRVISFLKLCWAYAFNDRGDVPWMTPFDLQKLLLHILLQLSRPGSRLGEKPENQALLQSPSGEITALSMKELQQAALDWHPDFSQDEALCGQRLMIYLHKVTVWVFQVGNRVKLARMKPPVKDPPLVCGEVLRQLLNLPVDDVSLIAKISTTRTPTRPM